MRLAQCADPIFACRRPERIDLAPVRAQSGIEDLLELYVAQMCGQKGNGCSVVAASGTLEHASPRLSHQVARRTIIKHAERCRHARFQRKAHQHILTESVNGLDLQAAGRFQGIGE